MKYAEIGSISEGTMKNEDLIPIFVETLEELDEDNKFVDLIKEANEIKDYELTRADSVMCDLFDAVEAFSPPHCHYGDATLYDIANGKTVETTRSAV